MAKSMLTLQCSTAGVLCHRGRQLLDMTVLRDLFKKKLGFTAASCLISSLNQDLPSQKYCSILKVWAQLSELICRCMTGGGVAHRDVLSFKWKTKDCLFSQTHASRTHIGKPCASDGRCAPFTDGNPPNPVNHLQSHPLMCLQVLPWLHHKTQVEAHCSWSWTAEEEKEVQCISFI